MMRTGAANIILSLVLTGLVACSGDATPPQQRIMQLNSDAETAAEAKDVGALKDILADDFNSDRFDKSSIIRLVQMYMLGHKSIHILSLTRSVQIVNEDHAAAQVLVALAGEPIARADQLFDLSADLLRFDVTYRRFDSEWKVVDVQWGRAAVDDFLE